MSGSNANLKITAPETLWFIARGDVMRGPFNAAQVSDMISSRELSALDYCWRQGFSEWRPVNSVEEFDRRGKSKTLSPYPNIEIPGLPVRQRSTETVEQQKVNSEPTRIIKKISSAKKEKIEVTFARVRRGPLSIYEWTAALTFSLLFSFFAVDFALSEVEEKVTNRIEWIELGRLKNEGYVPAQALASEKTTPVTPVWIWEPLYSAMGVRDLEKVYEKSDLPGVPQLPRTYVDYYVQGPQNPYESSARMPASESLKEPQAPITAGHTRKQGFLKFKDQVTVRVIGLGSPELP